MTDSSDQTTKVALAPVDTYEPAPAATRSLEDTILAEGRLGQVDQDADYHKRNPTLDTSGPEHDPNVLAELVAKAAKKEGPTSAEVKEAVADMEPDDEEE